MLGMESKEESCCAYFLRLKKINLGWGFLTKLCTQIHVIFINILPFFLCSRFFWLETIYHWNLGEILWRHKGTVEQVAVQCLRVTHPLSSFQKTIMMGKRERFFALKAMNLVSVSDVIQAPGSKLHVCLKPQTQWIS